MWCGPCQVSAAWHAQFSDYINEQGIPFHVLTVLTEDPSSGPTDQADAQSWATKFDLQDDIVMHASGDASSPLGNLAFDFGLANGQPAAYRRTRSSTRVG